jgi:uncharacterized protein
MDFLQRQLVKWVIRVVSFPKFTLAVCAAALLAAMMLAGTGLGLSTNQDDLMTPKLKFFKDYKEFTQEFPENESFVVILEPRDYAHPPAGKRWMELADRVGNSLLALTEHVRRVDWKVDTQKLGTQGLLFAPWEEVARLKGLAGVAALAQMMAPSEDPMMNGYQMIPDESKRGTPAYGKDMILIVNVFGKRDYSSLADVTEPLKEMRKAVAKAAEGYPEFLAPVITGRPALEGDEMATSDRDMRIAEILGLSLVFVVLLIFLRNLWMVVVAELCLGVGIGWTFGWATLVVGRLNLLSLVFVIALIGIGMDYLIQILTRYRFEKKRYTRPQAVWARVFRYVSPPISTACAGAAGAFLVSNLTNFQGAAELGLIAGGGLLLCLLAGYTVLPALLTLFPAAVGKVPESRRYLHKEPHPRAGGWRLIPAGLWLVVAAGGLWVSLPPEFDGNLLRLQADGLPSVKAVRKLSSFYAVVTSGDRGKLRAARAELLGRKAEVTGDALMLSDMPADKGSTIDHTDSLLSALDRQAWLQEYALATKPKLNAADLPAMLRDHLIGGRGADAATGGRGDTATASAPVTMEGATTRGGNGMWAADGATKQGARPIYAMYVYPKADLWHPAALEEFVKEVEKKVPTEAGVVLTGIAPQLYHSTQEIHKAFMRATAYALVLIFLLVMVDMGKVGQTLLAISVLGLGLPMLLLAMWVWRTVPVGGLTLEMRTGIPGSWNFANFFALPILIGAGHEYGVFMVHRYKETLHDPRRVWRFWDVSDRALLLCGIVTSCSFGFMVRAQHHGLQSLGWVMGVGTACIYLAAVVVVRPVLTWEIKRKGVYNLNDGNRMTSDEANPTGGMSK